MIVKVKYCGGCNASYDRTALVRRVREAFPSIRFVHANETRWDEKDFDGENFDEKNLQEDFALVVCGCPVKCADYKDFQGTLGRFVAASQNDFFPVCREIGKRLS